MAGLAVWTACGLDLEAAFTQHVEAEKLAADMRVQLHRSAGAAQHAVMADTDEASAGFAREAEEATRTLVSLGNKRKLTAACDATLVALQETLAKREFGPKR